MAVVYFFLSSVSLSRGNGGGRGLGGYAGVEDCLVIWVPEILLYHSQRRGFSAEVAVCWILARILGAG